MGVYKRKDGRYEVRIAVGIGPSGKTAYKSLYGDTREDVELKRRTYMEQEQITDDSIRTRDMKLLIIGSGSHGRDIKEIAESMRIFSKVKFLDDNVEGKDVIGKASDLHMFRNEYDFCFVGIGNCKTRKKFTQKAERLGFYMPSIISPNANISPKAEIGRGVAIMPNATVAESVVGDYCIIASNGLVSIDSTVGSYTHIDTGAMVLKNSVVPENTWVKSGKVFGKLK